ncbi:MAG: hypothetical protein JSW61_13975 [Candidatus Thorarchaeota archaeon]|nr:MAG: hypothetical protein JSW61_13975 [Candidatus Thorarchaeota archaeon]
MSNESPEQEDFDVESVEGVIRVKVSEIQFPEVCPVCLEDPEDLVAITITQTPRTGKKDSNISSAWTSGRKEVDVAIAALEAAATFWVPACMSHGSKSVRTQRKRAVAWVSFFVFFYPILISILLTATAIHYNMSLLEPLVGLALSSGLFLLFVGYGYYPRALEKAVRFIELDRPSNSIFLQIRGTEYREMFLELNGMNADLLQ